jgi:hypothetical protein
MSRFVVAGVVRDINSTLDEDLERIKASFGPLGKLSFILIESNSSDSSVRKLNEIANVDPNFHFLSLGESNPQKLRTEKIADARNAYLDFIQNNQTLAEADYLVVYDFNNLNSKLNTDVIRNSLNLQGWDVCTANQSTRYYDIWALRHPLWSPNDCWQQLDFYRQNGLRPDLALKAAVHSRMLHIDRQSRVINVDSAFGGFAIYKMNVIGSARYSGIDAEGKAICEHVPFHKVLKENGFKIIIDPQLINAGWVDHTNETRTYRKLIRTFKYPIKWIKKKIRS